MTRFRVVFGTSNNIMKYAESSTRSLVAGACSLLLPETKQERSLKRGSSLKAKESSNTCLSIY